MAGGLVLAATLAATVFAVQVATFEDSTVLDDYGVKSFGEPERISLGQYARVGIAPARFSSFSGCVTRPDAQLDRASVEQLAARLKEHLPALEVLAPTASIPLAPTGLSAPDGDEDCPAIVSREAATHASARVAALLADLHLDALLVVDERDEYHPPQAFGPLLWSLSKPSVSSKIGAVLLSGDGRTLWYGEASANGGLRDPDAYAVSIRHLEPTPSVPAGATAQRMTEMLTRR